MAAPSVPALIDDVNSVAWKGFFKKLGEYVQQNTGGYGPAQPRWNRIINGNCFIWQSGVTTSPVPSGAGFVHCDGWAVNCPAASSWFHTRAPIAGSLPGFVYCQRIGRVPGATNSDPFWLVHNLESRDCYDMQGKTVTFSFWARVGVGWTGAAFSAGRLISGQGEDQSRQSGAFSGEVYQDVNIAHRLSTSWQRFHVSMQVPKNATQLAVAVIWMHTGVSSPANDYIELTGFQLEIGENPSDFMAEPFDQALRRCQRRYFKTFDYNTTPAQNVGTANGAFRFPATSGGAVTVRGPHYVFPVTMRTVPTITTYSPLAASNQPHDTTAGLACSNVAIQAADNTITMTCTANAGTTAGNFISCHFTADARF